MMDVELRSNSFDDLRSFICGRGEPNIPEPLIPLNSGVSACFGFQACSMPETGEETKEEIREETKEEIREETKEEISEETEIQSNYGLPIKACQFFIAKMVICEVVIYEVVVYEIVVCECSMGVVGWEGGEVMLREYMVSMCSGIRPAEVYGENMYGESVYGENVYGCFAQIDEVYRTMPAEVYGESVYGENVYGCFAQIDEVYNENVYGESVYGENVYGCFAQLDEAYPSSMISSLVLSTASLFCSLNPVSLDQTGHSSLNARAMKSISSLSDSSFEADDRKEVYFFSWTKLTSSRSSCLHLLNSCFESPVFFRISDEYLSISFSANSGEYSFSFWDRNNCLAVDCFQKYVNSMLLSTISFTYASPFAFSFLNLPFFAFCPSFTDQLVSSCSSLSFSSIFSFQFSSSTFSSMDFLTNPDQFISENSFISSFVFSGMDNVMLTIFCSSGSRGCFLIAGLPIYVSLVQPVFCIKFYVKKHKYVKLFKICGFAGNSSRPAGRNSIAEAPANQITSFKKQNLKSERFSEKLKVFRREKELFKNKGVFAQKEKRTGRVAQWTEHKGDEQKVNPVLLLGNYKKRLAAKMKGIPDKFNNNRTKIRCPRCNKSRTRRKGLVKNKYQTFQRYFCDACNAYFTKNTPSPVKNKSYSPELIIKALSFYYQGYSLNQVRTILNRLNKKKTSISASTVHRWVEENKRHCTFSGLREQALKQYAPKEMIFSKRLHHNQVYLFKYHRAKLQLLKDITPLDYNGWIKIASYFQKIQSQKFPHHIFRSNKRPNQRGSQINLSLLEPEVGRQFNLSNYLARIALQRIKNNFQRHASIQDFMLAADSSTIAAEIPVYLTKYDVQFLKKWNINLNISETQTPVTGHIDLLQIRNNCIYILDYKPDADKEKPVSQLTFYALALASRLQIPLFKIHCAWFDENHYYKFSPLRCVYGKSSSLLNQKEQPKNKDFV